MKLNPTVIKLAIPIILANASTPFVGLVDTAMLGFSETGDFLAALTIGTTVLSSVYWLFGYLKMALTGIVAQARGRDDYPSINAAFSKSMRDACILAVIILLSIPIITNISLYFFGTTETINAYAAQYIRIRLWSAPAIMLNLAIAGLLFGLAKPYRVLIIFSVLNGTNIALDILFVKGFGLDIEGVAYASAIAEYMALLTGYFCIRPFISIKLRNLFQTSKIDGANTNSMYVDLFIRTILLQAILFFFVHYSAQFGPETLAANGILLQIAIFTFYGLDGIAHSAEMLVGAAFGKKNLQEFNYYCHQTLIWGMIVALFSSLLLYLGQTNIIALLTDIDSVVSVIDHYYIWLMLLPITSVACFVYDGIFIGTSETRIMRNMMFITVAIFGLLALLLIPLGGNIGLWLCYHASMLIRAILAAISMPSVRTKIAIS